VVHRDLKPENILVECDESTHEVTHIKLTDFGLSKIITPGELMTDSCGTPAYVAPEVLSKKGYSKEVDVWSTGVILYTMLARALPFHSSDRKKTFKLIKEADPDLKSECWESISEDCKDLIRKMLIKDPKERISVDDALKLPFFKRYEQTIREIRDQYHPPIEVAGKLRKGSSIASSDVLQNVLSRIKAMQSQTDYASMVGESGVSVNGLRHAPHSLHARPFVVQPGMHHVEDLEKEEERKHGKPNVKS